MWEGGHGRPGGTSLQSRTTGTLEKGLKALIRGGSLTLEEALASVEVWSRPVAGGSPDYSESPSRVKIVLLTMPGHRLPRPQREERRGPRMLQGFASFPTCGRLEL